jgi:hypothetical protein
MTLHLTISSANAAFEGEELGPEVARICRDLADKLEGLDDLSGVDLSVRDVNGNRVGTCRTVEDGADVEPAEAPYVRLSMETGNAAFADAPGAEVARILRSTAERVEGGELELVLRDINGNRVGAVESDRDDGPGVAEGPDGPDGPDSPLDPSETLIGDDLLSGTGVWWTVGRVEFVAARSGVAKLEPLFLLYVDDGEPVFDAKYADELKASFGGEYRRKFGYFVNLDERGEFYADVRDETGNTVFEVRLGGDDEDTSDLVQDGFMKHRRDISGLQSHLIDIGLIGSQDEILTMTDFTSQMEAVTDLGIEAAAAYERAKVVYWYGVVVAPESERAMLESLGATLGEYLSAEGGFAVKLSEDARLSISALGESFPLNVSPFSGQDKHLARHEAVEDMDAERITHYANFLRFAISVSEGKDWPPSIVEGDIAAIEALQTRTRGNAADAGSGSASYEP